MYRILATILLAGCAHQDHADDPALHACDEAGSTGAAVEATTSRQDSPDIELSLTPWTVTLPDQEAGFVRFVLDEEEDIILFTGTADLVAGLYHEDEEDQELPAGAPVSGCPEDLPEHFDLHLQAGTWHLELGPAAVDQVWLLLMDGDGHGHD